MKRVISIAGRSIITAYIKCDRIYCTNNVIFDGTDKDYERVRKILIKNDWWFDLAGCFCNYCHRKFNKGVNPGWNEVYAPKLPGLTKEAQEKIFKGKY